MAYSGSKLPIVIAGGGICGLAAAIALAKIGRSVHIVERENSFTTAGAGIQLGPNGMRVLRDLDVMEAVKEKAVAPNCIDIRSGQNGRILKQLPIQDYSHDQYGAPYWVMHRSALQQALLHQVGRMDGIEISMGCEVSALEERGDHVRVHMSDERIEDGSALIAADGIWSNVRSLIFPNEKPQYSGYSAWRTVVPIDAVPSLFRDGHIGLWLSPDSHLVHYPIEGGTHVNIVAILAYPSETRGWGEDTDGRELIQRFSGVWPPIRVLVNSLEDWQRWSLYDREPLQNWSVGRIVFAGDAAHPCLPFFAQGGVMALEDAAALATAVVQHGDNYEAAWRTYEARRRARVVKMFRLSRQNGMLYHFGPLLGFARNAFLSVMPAKRFLKRYDWVYGYKAG